MCIIFKCARMYPLLAAYQLKNISHQALVHCSHIIVRVLSKFILAILDKHTPVMDPNSLTMKEDEIGFIVNCLSYLIQSRKPSDESTDDLVFSSVEELLWSLDSLTSLSTRTVYCNSPLLFDILVSLCLHSDSAIARMALKVLWNLSFEPTTALYISNHENVICTLQSSWMRKTAISDLSCNILLVLGYGNAESKIK